MSVKRYPEVRLASSFWSRGRSLDRRAKWADLKVGPYENLAGRLEGGEVVKVGKRKFLRIEL